MATRPSTPPRAPDEAEIVKRLGRSASAWRRLRSSVEHEFAPVVPEWHWTAKTASWSLRLRTPRGVLLYLSPGEGEFLASFALGEKAALAAESAKLPAAVLAVVAAAPRYAEGRGVRLLVRDAKWREAIVTLLRLKRNR